MKLNQSDNCPSHYELNGPAVTEKAIFLVGPKLELEPSKELVFGDQQGHVNGVQLLLKNKRNDCEVYFKVVSDKSAFYSVRPSIGKILPNGECKVMIQPIDDLQTLDYIEQQSHQFTIMSAFVVKLTATPEKFWAETASNNKMHIETIKLNTKVVRSLLHSDFFLNYPRNVQFSPSAHQFDEFTQAQGIQFSSDHYHNIEKCHPSFYNDDYCFDYFQKQHPVLRNVSDTSTRLKRMVMMKMDEKQKEDDFLVERDENSVEAVEETEKDYDDVEDEKLKQKDENYLAGEWEKEPNLSNVEAEDEKDEMSETRKAHKSDKDSSATISDYLQFPMVDGCSCDYSTHQAFAKFAGVAIGSLLNKLSPDRAGQMRVAFCEMVQKFETIDLE